MSFKKKLIAFALAGAFSFTAIKGAYDYDRFIKNKGVDAGEINPPPVEDVIDPAIKDTEDVKDQIENSTIEEATKDKLARLLGLIESGLATSQAEMADLSYLDAQNSVNSALKVVDEIRSVVNTQQNEIENLEELNASINSLETSLRVVYLTSATQLTAMKYQNIEVKQFAENEVENTYQTIISPEGNAVYDGSSIGIIEDGFVYLEGGDIGRGTANLFASLNEKLKNITAITKNESGNYVASVDLGEGKTEDIMFNVNESGEIQVLTIGNNDTMNYEMNLKTSSLTEYTAKRDELAKSLTHYTGLKTLVSSLGSSYKQDNEVKIEQSVLMEGEKVCEITHVQSIRLNLFVEGVTYSKNDSTEYVEQKEGVVTYIGRDSKGAVVLQTKESEDLEVDYCSKMLGMIESYFSGITKLTYNAKEDTYNVSVNQEGVEIGFAIRLDSYGRIRTITYTKGVETQVYNFKAISRAEFDRLYSNLSAEIEQLRTEYNLGSNL